MPMNGGGEMNGGASKTWPKDVGIVNMEIYFPSQFVDQTELEAFDGVSAGKYTIGLGQTRMGVCSDVEDINSLCLTVLDRLVRNTPGLEYADIGRLEVGTETLIDKSKSVKSCLMKLFEESGNSDVEGVDSTNACYGGTAALFNCVSWIESSYWDKRYAVVVCADIAVYASGAARPTGGAGAVAMLIGPNAPLVLDRGLRSTHVQHVYDFYKPDLSSEYPVVDGQLSVKCYLAALDKCYQNYCRKAHESISDHVSLADFDALLFHTPFCKLVQKSMGRLALNDFMRLSREDRLSAASDLQAFVDVKLEDTYFDKAVEKAFMTQSKAVFEAKTKPSLHMATNVGNMYTASLYGGLVSHLCSKTADELIGSRIGLFSYGSGLVSSFFSLSVQSHGLEALLANLASVPKRLEGRAKLAPESFDKMMKLREETHHKVPYQPVGDVKNLFPGTWYLTQVDDKARRSYARHEEEVVNGHS